MIKTPLWPVLLAILTLTHCATTPEDKLQQLEEVQDSDWHYKMASGYFNNHDIPQAIQELTISLQKDPKNADALYLLGFIYLGRQEPNKAYGYFDEAIRARENFYSAYNGRGSALLALKRWEDAKKDFVYLTEQVLYTTQELAYNNLGWAEYNLGEFKEALVHFDRAIFLKPEFCLGYNNKGLAQEALNRFEEAQRSYERAIERCGEHYAEPHFHLGKILASQGDPAALKALKTCIEINPESKMADRCREYYNALQH